MSPGSSVGVRKAALAWRLVVLVLFLLAFAGGMPAWARPTCSECGKVLVGTYYRMGDGRLLCPQDYQRLGPRCEACGTLIVGSYVVLERTHTVCRPCHEGYPGCFVCAVPVLRDGRRLADGRMLCRRHTRGAVTEAGTARKVLEAAERAVAAALGEDMRLQHRVDAVKVVGSDELRRIIGGRASAAGQIMGLFHLKVQGDARHYTVYFLSGLPEQTLLTVAAHEYAHAWQSERNQRYLECSDRFREGFAEWVAYRANRALGRSTEAERLLASRTGVYAVGLRRFLDAETRRGGSGILDLAGTGLDL